MDFFKKKEKYAVIVLLILNLVVSGGIINYLVADSTQDTPPGFGFNQENAASGEKYLLYIGLNDKDTYKQEIPSEEAREIVNTVCARHTGGYTTSDANGGWLDETNTFTQENTLVYTFYDISEETLTAVMDEILEKLNQNSILIEKQQAVYMYYSGNK